MLIDWSVVIAGETISSPWRFLTARGRRLQIDIVDIVLVVYPGPFGYNDIPLVFNRREGHCFYGYISSGLS